MVSQNLHDRITIIGSNLKDYPQFFVEQGAQAQIVASCADLWGPIFTVAEIGPAVADAVAFGEEPVKIILNPSAEKNTYSTKLLLFSPSMVLNILSKKWHSKDHKK